MSAFQEDLAKFSATVQSRLQTVFVNVASAAKLSITDGSALTGAPGQPVDTGALKASWQLTQPSPLRAEIATFLKYAPANEYGINNGKPYTQRSPVGGRFSVTQTAANIQNLVNDEVQKVTGGGA